MTRIILIYTDSLVFLSVIIRVISVIRDPYKI